MISFDIIQAWIAGGLESSQIRVLQKDADWIRYSDESQVKYTFYLWFQSLGNDPFGVLRNAGCMDEGTFNLIRSRVRTPAMKVEAVRVAKKDRERLRLLPNATQSLSYSEWAELLGFGSKGGGAYAFIKKVEAKGLVTVGKASSGTGVFVRLTARGSAVL